MDYTKLADGKRKITARPFKKILSFLLTLALVFGAVPGFTQTARAANGGTAEEPTIIDSNLGAATLNPGYYKLQGTFTNSGRLIVSGDVHLELADGANVTVNGGIGVNAGNALTIDGNTGVMVAQNSSSAGIGGNNYSAGGTITINGGTIKATGAGDNTGGAGIGGGYQGAGGSITINGGKVNANGGNYGAGIGGGYEGAGGTIIINGGTVTATGGTGNPMNQQYGGAGIGGGCGGGSGKGAAGTITIGGGTVTATGGAWSAGIGGGGGGTFSTAKSYGGAGGNITITGGTITATKGTNNNKGDIGPGYNGGNGTVRITGGSVNCKSATKIVGTLTNGSVDVYLATLTLTDAGDSAQLLAAGYGADDAITTNYGVKDVVTRDTGKVYFYLPAAAYTAGSIAAALSNGNQYANSVEINVNTSGTGTLSTGSAPTLQTATLNVKKDSSNWNNHGRLLTSPNASLQNADTAAVTINSLLAGPYTIYDGGIDTGLSVVASGGGTLNYKTPDASDFSLTNNTATYSGGAKPVTITPLNGAGNATAYYTGTGGTTYGSATAPANAGTYAVTANAAEGAWNSGTLYLAAIGLSIGTLTIHPKTIDISAIPGVTVPAFGAAPVSSIAETAQYTGTVSWSPSTDTFGYATVYTATITLTPKANYTLSGVGENLFTVQGAAATNIADSGTITAVFPATANPPLTGTPAITLNANTGELTAVTSGLSGLGALTYAWSGTGVTDSNAGTLAQTAYSLGEEVTLTVSREDTAGSKTAKITVYRTDISKSGEVSGDDATIADAYGKEGDTITIAYTLADSGTASDTLTYGDVSSVPAQVTSAGSGNSVYTVAAGDATGGVITIIATFLHTDKPVVYSVTPSGADVPISTENLVITFSKEMDITAAGTVTLNGDTANFTGGAIAANDTRWNAEKTVLTIPLTRLAYDTTYNISISGFMDTSGNVMEADSARSFSTPATYTVSISAMTNGTVTPDKTAYVAGETVTLTIVPSANYELDGISAYKTGEAGTTVALSGSGTGNRTFTMPAYAVTVEAAFVNPGDQAAVNTAKGLIESGTYTVAQTMANTDAAVKDWLATQINGFAGMLATGITVSAANIAVSAFTAATSGDHADLDGSDGSFSFTVSLAKGSASDTTTTKNGTITATAAQTYTLSVSAADANGGVSGTSSGSYAEDTQISVTATANGGYHFKDWTASGVTINLTANPAVFSMPAGAVTLTANFEGDDPTVTSVTVSAPNIEVQTGTSQQFAATVHGTNNPSQAVIWSVLGNSSAVTSITQSALLTVAGDEANSTLTVTATSALNGAVFGTATVTVTSGTPAPVTAVSLDTGNYVFPGAVEGYTAQMAKTVTATSTGNQATGALNVALSGDATAFVVSPSTIDITLGGTADFTVSPDIGLSAGNYSTTVSITSGSALADFDVSFTVNPAPTYTVTVQNDGNGAADASPASAIAGTPITLAATPNSGYRFKEWQVVSGGVSVSGDTFNMPAENVVVKAIFEPIPVTAFTITFDANGGTVSPVTMRTGADGRPATLPTPMIGGNYRFDGWFTAASGGTQITSATVFSENTTVYAHWTYTGGGGGGSNYPPSTPTPTTPTPQPANPPTDIGSTVTTPEGNPPVPNPGGGSTLSDGGTVNLPDGVAIVVPPGTIISGDGGTITVPKGWDNAEIVYPSGRRESVQPGYTIDISDPKTPHVSLNFPFADVNPSDWFHDDVVYVYIHGLFAGTGDTEFSPNASMTRGMIVTVPYRLAGEPGYNGGGAAFDDVDSSAYYANAVAWAKQNSIVSGTGGNNFSPDAEITRQDMAVILYRYMEYANINLPVTEQYVIFADEAGISDYAKNAIQVLNKLGIINGVGAGAIDPQGKATRAQVAAMLHRFAEAVH